MEGEGDFEGGQGGKGSESWWIWSGEEFPSDLLLILILMFRR